MLLVTQYFACGQAPAARIWPRLEELKRNKLRVKWSRGEWDEGSFSSLSLRPILDDRACSRATRGVKRYLRTLEAIKHNISSLRTARGTWPEDRRVETARETVDASANPTGGLMKVSIPAQLWHLKTTSLTPGYSPHPDQLKPKTAGQLVVTSCMSEVHSFVFTFAYCLEDRNGVTSCWSVKWLSKLPLNEWLKSWSFVGLISDFSFTVLTTHRLPFK